MNKVKGIIPPPVTPILDRDALDVDGLSRLLEHVLEGGVHGVFALGTTGEAPSLSYRMRCEVIRRVCGQVAGRVPVFVGVTDTSFVESIDLAKVAANCGADVVVLAMPFYYPAGQSELVHYIKSIVPQLPLPVILYNMPAMTKVTLEVDTLKQLAGLDRILGIKDSSGDLNYLADLQILRSLRPDWSIHTGPEHLLIKSVLAGADGGVNGGANIFPELFVDAYEAAVEGDDGRMEALQLRIDQLQGIYDVGQNVSRFIKGTKCALSVLGVCNDFMAEPFERFRTNERKQIQRIISEHQQLSASH